MTVKTRILWLIASLLVGVVWVWLWARASEAQLLPRAVLPGPDRVWAALRRGFANGTLPDLMGETTLRMLIGWLLASVLGIVLGCAIGMSPLLRRIVSPTLEMLRPIPAAALLPVGIAFFGLTETMVLTCIAIAAGWPTLLASVHGFSSIEPRLREVSQVLGLSRLATFWKISLPSALPDIFAATRLSLTIALIVACLAEWMVSKPGLGHHIFYSSENFRAADVFSGIVLICVIALVSAAVLGLIERRLMSWNVKR